MILKYETFYSKVFVSLVSQVNLNHLSIAAKSILENLEILRLYKTEMMFESYKKWFQEAGFMKATRYDLAQVNKALCFGDEAQNKGNFELFAATSSPWPGLIYCPHYLPNYLIWVLSYSNRSLIGRAIL